MEKGKPVCGFATREFSNFLAVDTSSQPLDSFLFLFFVPLFFDSYNQTLAIYLVQLLFISLPPLHTTHDVGIFNSELFRLEKKHSVYALQYYLMHYYYLETIH